MKVKDLYLLKEVAEQWVLMPSESSAQNNDRMITLSSSAAMLWKELEKGVDSIEDLANALLSEYEIDYKTALKDASDFVDQLRINDMIDEEQNITETKVNFH